MKYRGGSPTGPGTVGERMGTQDSDVPPSSGLSASCPRQGLPRFTSLHSSLSNMQPNPPPLTKGTGALLLAPFWIFLALFLSLLEVFNSTPSCQAARFSWPGRRSLLQLASSQTPVSAQPPTTTPTHGSSEVSCKIRNISLGDPCSRGDGEKACSSGNKSQRCFQLEAPGLHLL